MATVGPSPADRVIQTRGDAEVGYHMDNAQQHIMTLEDSYSAKKACERSSFNIGFAVIRQ